MTAKVRGLMRATHSSFGFEPHNSTLVGADLRMAGYSTDRVPVMQKRMMEAVAAQKAQTSAQLWRGPLQLAAKTLWSPFWIVASITHIATSPETFGLDQPV